MTSTVTPSNESWVGVPGPPLSEAELLATGVYLTILGLVAFLGNGCVILVIVTRKPSLKKLHNFLLLNLALVDLTLAILAYPLTAVAGFAGRWIFSGLLCQVHGFAVFFLSVVNMNTLVVIAIYRYILVCVPTYHHLLEVSYAKYCLAAVWFYSAVWTSLPLFGWSSYALENFGTSCTLNWNGRTQGDYTYICFTIFLCYILQLSTITVCYAKIALKSRSLHFGVERPPGSCPKSGMGSTCMKLEEMLWHHKVLTEKNVTTMCLTMIVTYFVIWTPYALLSFLTLFDVYFSPGVTAVPTMFAKMSCASNPVIYCFTSSRFRQALLRLGGVSQQQPNRTTVHSLLLRNEALPDRVGVQPDGSIEMRPRPRSQSQPEFRLQESSSHAPNQIRDSRNGTTAQDLCQYQGDMTKDGVYIGNMVVAIQADSTVF